MKKARSRLSRSFLKAACLLLLIPLATLPASLLNPADASVRSLRSAAEGPPLLLWPPADERVPESVGTLEVSAPPHLESVRVVVSRERFDPSNWDGAPAGAAWFVGQPGATSVPLAALSIPIGAETELWWTAVAREANSGRWIAAEPRRFVVIPSFANRVATGGHPRPSATGWLAPMKSRAPRPSYRSFRLASGALIEPERVAGSAAAGASTLAPAGAAGRRACLVQFAEGGADSARVRIERAGGTIVAPISGEAWLVRVDDAARARLALVNGEPWVADWQPQFKLSAAIDGSSIGRRAVTALLFPDGDEAATVTALGALGAFNVRAYRGSVNRLVRFELEDSRMAEAAALPDIAWIEPAPRDSVSNDQAQWVTQTGVPNSRTLWDHGIRGHGQIVMTADSGIRPDHEMFNDSLVALTHFGDYPTHRKIIAYWPGSDDPGIAFGDDVGSSYHGTHTAGTVAGNPDATSSAPWSGMAKEARLYFMDMAGPNSNGGLAAPADLNDLFQRSFDGNAAGAARISSNSWGDPSSLGAYTLASMEVDQFMWSHPDYLIAFAAGNQGVVRTVQSPGTAKNCLSVGATGNGTLDNNLASFSSRGPTADLRYKPTVMAPGDGVTSSIGSTRYTYATYSGTSMSTPAVAGTMALMREYLTEGWYPTGSPVAANELTPSAALLKAMAINSSRNDILGYTIPSIQIGWGRLTADDVLYFPGDSSRTLLVDGADGLLDQQYVEYQVDVTDPSRPLKIALCWTDAPGNPASSVQLVNDLDLIVSKGGATFLGNYFLNGNSGLGGHRDSLNVEEVVRVQYPTAGIWTVRVEGHRVLQGPQPFALCATGGINTGAGSVALDRFEYGLTDTIGIEVTDVNAHEPLLALVHSNTETSDEVVHLTGSNGVFRGRLPIAPSTWRPGDGVLSVSSGDRITVTYNDDLPLGALVATAPVNANPPQITGVHATATSPTSATVTWTTDVPATSRVRFGLLAPAAAADSSGLTRQHVIQLTGLAAASTYRYDVESTTRTGSRASDSLGGQHRQFTTRPGGSIALVMDDPSPTTLAVWTNALAQLGWNADVITRAEDDPPLVGNSTAGLRRYSAVLWQVDPDRYPPLSDVQRLAIDSLLTGGARLLLTGHDIGYGLSSMDVPSYTPEREAWFESRLKTRFGLDLSWADTLRGLPGDPVTGDFTSGVKYHPELYPDAGDEVSFAPNNDVIGDLPWLDDQNPPRHVGIAWETVSPQGTPGNGVWGGAKSRYLGLYYEWVAMGSTSVLNDPNRTSVLERSVDWLLGHRPPTGVITAPAPGAVVTGDFLAIRYVTAADSGHSIARRMLSYSLDGGESWAPITSMSCADSGYIWDLAGALGGTPVSNSTLAMVRLVTTDDGVPAASVTTQMAGTFTLARAGGDTRGPLVLAGTVMTMPSPIRRGSPATLSATVSDAETGGSTVAAAEYSIGPSPAPAGAGLPMSGSFGASQVVVSAALNTAALGAGDQTLWLRARDGAGNWGAPVMVSVIANDFGVLAVSALQLTDYLEPAAPNPSRDAAHLRFGLAHEGEVRLELFDVAGRRVRSLLRGPLAAGPHFAVWDGRDDDSRKVQAGIYLARLLTPDRSFVVRLVRLE